MLTSYDDLIAQLKALKPTIVARYKVREIGLFGSTVHGKATETSDVDLLVEFEDEADLFDWVGVALFLEDALQRRVDVVPKQALREELREAVLSEVVPI